MYEMFCSQQEVEREVLLRKLELAEKQLLIEQQKVENEAKRLEIEARRAKAMESSIKQHKIKKHKKEKKGRKEKKEKKKKNEEKEPKERWEDTLSVRAKSKYETGKGKNTRACTSIYMRENKNKWENTIKDSIALSIVLNFKCLLQLTQILLQLRWIHREKIRSDTAVKTRMRISQDDTNTIIQPDWLQKEF